MNFLKDNKTSTIIIIVVVVIGFVVLYKAVKPKEDKTKKTEGGE